MESFQKYLDYSDEVKSALKQKKAVVALESTIISHGFPYPENVECALQCEAEIRAKGAVPATVAIINGRIKIGLNPDELEYLAVTKGIAKASRRDIAVLIAKKRDGATTVAATMLLAAMAKIQVFATGGIGGVHREAQSTFDISADLEELAATPVCVVCAGAKSILDLALTREYLETAGVPVIGYQSDDLPCFYTRSSGLSVDYRIDSCAQIAAVLKTKKDLGLKGGVIIGNPIPAEYELEPDMIDGCIQQALDEAKAAGVSGKALTPFLLARIHDISGGKSVVANKALVYHNASVAAEIAVELSKLEQ